MNGYTIFVGFARRGVIVENITKCMYNVFDVGHIHNMCAMLNTQISLIWGEHSICIPSLRAFRGHIGFPSITTVVALEAWVGNASTVPITIPGWAMFRKLERNKIRIRRARHLGFRYHRDASERRVEHPVSGSFHMYSVRAIIEDFAKCGIIVGNVTKCVPSISDVRCTGILEMRRKFNVEDVSEQHPAE